MQPKIGKTVMEKWRASRHILGNATKPRIHRWLTPYSENSISRSGSEGNCVTLQPHTEHQNRILLTSFRHRKDYMGHGKTCAVQQYRYFGSVATEIQRKPAFSTLNSDDIRYFKEILGEKNVIQDEDRLQAANTDWMQKYRGSSKLLLQPRSTEEISQILKYCNSRCLAIVPQGGNTGLVGGSVPVFDEVT